MVDGAALEKRCAKAPRVRIPPSPPTLLRSDGPWPRWRLRSSLTHLRVRSLRCSARRLARNRHTRRASWHDRAWLRRLERSPSGLWRRTGNAVRGNPSRVRIPPSPPTRAAWIGRWPRWRLRSSLTHLRVRSLRCSAPPWPRTAQRGALRCRAMTDVSAVTRLPVVIPLEMGDVRLPRAGAGWIGPAVVIGYAIRHADGGPPVRHRVSASGTRSSRPRITRGRAGSPRSSPRPASQRDEIGAVVNCHLHADHAGQNGAFPGVPIYVQPAEWEIAHTTDHTILEWIDAPGDRLPPDRRRPRAVPGDPGHRDARPHARPPVAGRRDRPPAGRSWPARRSTASANGPATRTASRAGRARRDRDGLRPLPRAPARDSIPARVLFGHDRRSWTARTDRAI